MRGASTSAEHQREELAAADVTLCLDVIARADDLINEKTVHGNRYKHQRRSEVDTEEF